MSSNSLRTIGVVADSGQRHFVLVVQWDVRKLGNSRIIIQKLDVKSNFTEMCVFCFALLL